MEAVCEYAAREELWEMLCADELCILAESTEQLQNRVRELQEAFVRKSFKVNERRRR